MYSSHFISVAEPPAARIRIIWSEPEPYRDAASAPAPTARAPTTRAPTARAPTARAPTARAPTMVFNKNRN
jgi:hypothetical protein